MKEKWNTPPKSVTGNLIFIGQTRKNFPKLFICKKKKSTAHMAINIDSCFIHDSCRTAEILTVYLRVMEIEENYLGLKRKQFIVIKRTRILMTVKLR